MKIRVTSTGISGAGETRIVNAETGEEVDGVRAVRFAHDGVGENPVLTLDVIDFEFSAEIDGASVVVRRDPTEAASK